MVLENSVCELIAIISGIHICTGAENNCIHYPIKCVGWGGGRIEEGKEPFIRN